MFLTKKSVPFIAVTQRDLGSRLGIWHVEVPTAFLKRAMASVDKAKSHQENLRRLSEDYSERKLDFRREMEDLKAAHAEEVSDLKKRLQKLEGDIKAAIQRCDDAEALAAGLNARITAHNGAPQGPEPRSPIRMPALEGTKLGGHRLPGSYGSGKRG